MFNDSKLDFDKDIFQDMEDYISSEKHLNDLEKKAYILAQKLHEGQTRDEGTPYFEHVDRVAKRVKELNELPNNIMIAYLHDILEDTYINYDDLAKIFGFYIANGVRVLTKVKDSNYTFERYLNNIIDDENSSLLTIKIVDRIDNIKSLKHCPNVEKIKKYLEETEQIFIPAIEDSRYAEFKRYKKLIKELKEEVSNIKIILKIGVI